LRVLKPNGIFVILETSVPTKFPFKQGYNFYMKTFMPLLGKIFSKDKKAYEYLSESAKNLPYGEQLHAILRKVGFENVKHSPQTMGVATIYSASKYTYEKCIYSFLFFVICTIFCTRHVW